MNNFLKGKDRAWFVANRPDTRPLFAKIDRLCATGDLVPLDDLRFKDSNGKEFYFLELEPLIHGYTLNTLDAAWHVKAFHQTGEADPLMRVSFEALQKTANSAKAGVGNLQAHNSAKTADVSDRLSLLRNWYEHGDSAAKLRRRIVRETGEILDVTDRQIRRDLKIIRGE